MQVSDTLISKVEDILLKKFPTSAVKQRVNVSEAQINFACPLCGDSKKNEFKKRGSIILHGDHEGMYKCHNCGRYMSLEKFLVEASSAGDVYFDEELVKELKSAPRAKKKTSKETARKAGKAIGLLIDDEIVKRYCYHKTHLMAHLGYVLIDDAPPHAKEYLTNRMQYSWDDFLYSRKLNAIIILNQTLTGHVLGLQYRFLSPKKGQAKYRSMGYEEIVKKMKEGEDFDIRLAVPEDTLETLKELSYFFGIAKVDPSKEVTITEGFFDALLIPNAIATSGAGRTPPKLFKRRFMYDDDETGRTKSLKGLKNGEYVFLWRKFRSDYHIPDRSKWDFNDVFIYLQGKKKTIGDLSPYFGNDKFDLINV